VAYENRFRVAKKVAHEAAGQLARGHKISARDSFMRAATYYCASEFFLHANGSTTLKENEHEHSRLYVKT
jgi:hypothetical protein